MCDILVMCEERRRSFVEGPQRGARALQRALTWAGRILKSEEPCAHARASPDALVGHEHTRMQNGHYPR